MRVTAAMRQSLLFMGSRRAITTPVMLATKATGNNNFSANAPMGHVMYKSSNMHA